MVGLVITVLNIAELTKYQHFQIRSEVSEEKNNEGIGSLTSPCMSEFLCYNRVKGLQAVDISSRS